MSLETTTGIARADLADAAQLIRYACQPKLLPSRDPDYQHLVRAWTTGERPGLVEATEVIANALGIWVVEVEGGVGIVASSEADSPFELRIGDFMRQARAENQWSQRVVFAVTLLAAWRLCFPLPTHLDDPQRVGRVSQDELLDYVDGLCARLDEQADAAGEDVAPPVDEPGLERAWRAWARRGMAGRTSEGRMSSRATSAIAGRALEWMVRQGLLEKVNDDRGGTYRSRPRLRVLVRELAGTDIYHEVLAMADDMALPEAGDGDGSGGPSGSGPGDVVDDAEDELDSERDGEEEP